MLLSNALVQADQHRTDLKQGSVNRHTVHIHTSLPRPLVIDPLNPIETVSVFTAAAAAATLSIGVETAVLAMIA